MEFRRGFTHDRTRSSVRTSTICVFALTVSCIEAFEEVFETRADATSSKIDDMIAPLFSESLRLFVCLIWILSNSLDAWS